MDSPFGGERRPLLRGKSEINKYKRRKTTDNFKTQRPATRTYTFRLSTDSQEKTTFLCALRPLVQSARRGCQQAVQPVEIRCYLERTLLPIFPLFLEENPRTRFLIAALVLGHVRTGRRGGASSQLSSAFVESSRRERCTQPSQTFVTRGFPFCILSNQDPFNEGGGSVNSSTNPLVR